MSRKRKDNVGEDDLEGYDSSFEDDEEGTTAAKRHRKADLTDKEPAPNIVPSGSTKSKDC